MDDLAGLDWNSSGNKQSAKPSAPAGSNYFPSLRPQATPPISGRSTPVTIAPSGIASKPATPAQNSGASGPSKDSFANLLSSSSGANSTKNLSLAEQQRRLQQQKSQQAGLSAANTGNEDAWARLGGSSGSSPSGLSGPSNARRNGASPQMTGSTGQASRAGALQQSQGKSTESESDLLAGFSADAPVDKSTYFPAPSDNSTPARGTPVLAKTGAGGDFSGADDDDDPFGLGGTTSGSTYKPAPVATADQNADDDDILGDLGKPVSDLPPRPKAASPPSPEASSSPSVSADGAVAELVDMGFPVEKARQALEVSDGDVQAAVGWLLTRAHEESRKKTHSPAGDDGRARRTTEEPSRSSSAPRRSERGAPSGDDKDPALRASELGASLWKGANSLWKSGKKQLDKAVADFNSESDSSQPRWMRESSTSRSSSAAARPGRGSAPADLTDEAMMLDSHDSRPQPRQKGTDSAGARSGSAGSSARQSRDQSPALPSRPAASSNSQIRPAWQQQQQQQAPSARSKLSKQMVEEESAQAYVSPARRKKTPAKPTSPGPDLLEGSSAPRQVAAAASAQSFSKPIAVRPAAKTRSIPSVSSIALKSSTQHRTAGTMSFKRGDYASADSSYSSAIRALPSSHPVVILLLTNRATTRLKIGDAKGALVDSDQAIELIGPARGVGEAIEVSEEDGGGTASKDMAPFWGKAIMKRAEALEHMERWNDAASAWRDAVQGGVGGANAIQGRNRCEKAANPKPTAPKPPSTARPAARSSGTAKPQTTARPRAAVKPESREAVNRLREANKEAERVDDEKFRLSDSVDEWVNAWRKGKEANLRALLGSLDTVLWADSGWKKVGMGELIVPGKVKIAYMKGIGKVHPDKLPTTATTEQIMISGMVFSTLNEAWDKFKAENGL